MKYLSFDIEATGLDENDLMIEFAMIPFCTESRTLEHDLKFHRYIKCPPFEELKPRLNEWVAKNNRDLIIKANEEGIEKEDFKKDFDQYLKSPETKKYFNQQEQIVLFGKSLNAIDLPFMNRDLGWDYMRTHFSHRTLDLTSYVIGKIDEGKIPSECISGSKLMEYLKMGDVAHTALEDAQNTAIMYLKLLTNVQ
ncbi:MAG: hypothetical protein H6622_05025 [Halobacteriovoraceae bacterium]|nr:hypothetical protein [Halobacteriovoraceae bacterium]